MISQGASPGFSRIVLALLCSCFTASAIADEQIRAPAYSTCKTWLEVATGENLHYANLARISDPGRKTGPLTPASGSSKAFNSTKRAVTRGMKVDFKERDVSPIDSGEIGYIDLKNDNKWTKIGETTAWNWQQAAARPGGAVRTRFSGTTAPMTAATLSAGLTI